jgi:hypothetical protein
MLLHTLADPHMSALCVCCVYDVMALPQVPMPEQCCCIIQQICTLAASWFVQCVRDGMTLLQLVMPKKPWFTTQQIRTSCGVCVECAGGHDATATGYACNILMDKVSPGRSACCPACGVCGVCRMA